MSRRLKTHKEAALPLMERGAWRAERSRLTPLLGLLTLASVGCLVASPHSAHADTIVDQGNSIILVDTTWDLSGSPYILQRDVEVRPQATLTINPGVEVRFGDSDNIASGEDPNGVELIVKGALVAHGTAQNPISFNGQNFASPLDHATGLRFATGARASSVAHLRIEGLAYGVDVRADDTFTLSADHLYIDAGKTAFRRTIAMGDQVFTNSTFIAPEGAIDVVSGVEDAIFTLSDGNVTGDVIFRGDLTISSELNVIDSALTGDLSVMGSLQAASQFNISGSTVQQGTVYVQGSVNTSASLVVTESTLTAPAFRDALNIGGAVLADARVELSGSNISGDLKVGPTVALSGADEGQYVFVNTPSTWPEAQASCAQLGGRLADATTSRESELLYELAKRSSDSGLVWTAGTLVSPPCGPGSTYIDIGDQGSCNGWDATFPVRTVTTGKDCGCGTVCPSRTETREDLCFPYNFTCTLDVSYQALLPDCDTGDVTGEYCYGESVSWAWDNGAAFDQTNAIWGLSEADRLACFSGEHTLSDELHIAIDVQDATGSTDGRLGLWRSRKADQTYSFICEGRLGVVSSQDVSRGALTLSNNTLTGRFESHVGALTLTGNTFSGLQNHTLFRSASVVENSFEGAFNLTSRSLVTLTRNQFTQHVLYGGGVMVEADFTNAYANTVDQGEHGFVFRGPARVENNIITRSFGTAIALYPEAGPSPTDESFVLSNTLVENHDGMTVSATINGTRTTLANNLIHRGDGVGIANLGNSQVVTSHNNISAYGALYQNVSPDAGSMSVNPLLVADFPANPPILRIDSGSPLIDMGSCALATTLDFDGAPRPFDGDFDETAGCDIGAYEFGPSEVFIYADGAPATSTSFSTGREVTLSLWGARDNFIFEVNPVDWSISEAVGVFDEPSGRFRPTPTPGVYAGAISASFGALTASLDVDLECGCIAPDNADGSAGGCNDVPTCYYTDWSSSCNVRENYCRTEQIVDVGSFENPVVIAADETTQLRAGGRDIFGTVFRINGPFTYEIVAGGGSVNSLGRFTAGTVAGDFPQTLRIAKGSISGLSNVIVTPAEPHSIVISKPAQTIGTTRTLQYSAEVRDRFGNVIPDAPVTWSLANAADAQINATGRVTAGCVPGSFGSAVVATSGLIEQRSDLVVTVGGANLAELSISPASIDLAATQSQNFEAFVTDSCGYTRPANFASFTARVNAGSVDTTSGAFTASCNLGLHPTAVTVSAEGFETTAAVNVTDAPLASIRLQPENARVEINTSAVFQVIGEDACGRIKTDLEPQWSSNIVNATMSTSGAPDFQRLNVACANLNNYADGVRARVIANNALYQAVASVDVVAGVPDSLTVNQVSLSLPAGNDVQLVASAADACNNSRDDALRYQASNGSVSATGLYTAGCVRGSYPDAIYVRAGSLENTIDVNVTDGVLNSIEIEPSAVSIQAGESRLMRANLFDGCRNLIDGTPTWSVAQAGSISPNGNFTAGTVAGTYNAAIVAELNGFQDQADLTITPAAAARLVVTPNPVTLPAGGSVALSVTAYDQFDNPFSADPSWTVNPSAGVVNAEDQFIASSRVGFYNDALVARVGGVSTPIDVEVVPAEVASILVEALEPPTGEPLDLGNLVAGQAQTITFEATALDAFGNEVSVSPALFQWAVSQGGGSAAPISGLPRALYTVGAKAQGHVITATIGGVTGSIPVTIRPADPERLFIFDVTPPNNTITQVTLEPNLTYQLGVRVEDAYENVISMPVTYSIVRPEEDLLADPPVIPVNASVSPSGVIRAGTISGDATIVVTATQELVVAIDLTVLPGEPVEIAVLPEQLVLTPQETVELTAQVKDAFGNIIVRASPTRPSASVSWADLDVTGAVTPTGLFTAGNVAGTFANALVVRARGLERFINVTVTPGVPVAAQIQPNPVISTPGSSVPLSMVFRDAQGNVTTATDASISWGLRANSAFVMGADGLLTLDCTNGLGFYEDEVQASVTLPGVVNPVEVIADIEVRPGLTDTIEVTPTRADVPVTGVFLFSAVAKDACGYPANAVPQWSVVSGEGTITAQGRFVASTASTFPTPDNPSSGAPVQLIARVGEISSPIVPVTVEPGAPTQLEMEPPEVDAVVTDRVSFRAIAEDGYGNRWVPRDVVWAVANEQGVFAEGSEPIQAGPVGAISELGVLESTVTSGRYMRSVRASFEGRSATANVVLSPDAPDHINVTPEDVTVIPNQIFEFSATVFDQFENIITNREPVFTCDGEVGLCQESGVLTATDRVGEYVNSVEARVGDVVGRASVTVVNAAPSRIEVTPEMINAAMGSETEVFTATVYDEEGVVIEGAAVRWRLEDPALGTLAITPTGGAKITIGTSALNENNPTRGYSSYLTASLEELQTSVNIFVPYDFDQDGIFDLTELDRGLNPEDASDAEADFDEDGLTNRQEINATDPDQDLNHLDIRDADTDNDGVIDGDEPAWDIDTDRDGSINALDSDSDNDGVLDGTEQGVTQPDPDTQMGEGFRADEDPETRTDPLRVDSDNDGIADGVEDANRNGRLDPGETPATRDFNYIYCDPTAELTGCPDGLICLETICTEPEQEEDRAPDEGCDATHSATPHMLWLLALVGLMATRRRERDVA